MTGLDLLLVKHDADGAVGCDFAIHLPAGDNNFRAAQSEVPFW